MNILFIGYYGKMNIGDDAFCVISEWAVKKYWKENNISFLARNLPFSANNKHLKSSLFLKKHIKGVSFVDAFIQGLKHDIIIYSGGSLFHSLTSFFSDRYFLRKSSIFTKTKVGAIGISLGPFKNEKAYLQNKQYLKTFAFLSLRDKKSFKIAKKMDLGIPIIEAFDLAGLLPDIFNKKLESKIKTNKLVVGISLCNGNVHDSNEVKRTMVRNNKILDYANKLADEIENIEFKMLVFNGDKVWGEERITQEFKNNLSTNINSEIIHYSNNTLKMWEAINNCGFVLSTRLHAGIFSFFSKIPFIQVEYHRKCSDFLDDICFPNDLRIGDFEVSVDNLVSKTIRVIANKDLLFDKYNLLRKKAMLNFTETFKYVK